MSLIVDIADAVVAALNAATFDPPFTATRAFMPARELGQLTELAVSVHPKATVRSFADRSSFFLDHSVDVAVQKKLGADIDAEIEPLLALVRAIDDALAGIPLAGLDQVFWLSSTNEPIYAPEHLQESRVFTSVVTVTYRSRVRGTGHRP